METDGLKARWREDSDRVIEAIVAWRDEHRKATFQEIESTVEAGLAELRAQMLEDAALVSAAADLRNVAADERPLCPACGATVRHHKRDKRILVTQYNKTVTLERSYAICPQCGEAFFPPR